MKYQKTKHSERLIIFHQARDLSEATVLTMTNISSHGRVDRDNRTADSPDKGTRYNITMFAINGGELSKPAYYRFMTKPNRSFKHGAANVPVETTLIRVLDYNPEKSDLDFRPQAMVNMRRRRAPTYFGCKAQHNYLAPHMNLAPKSLFQ